MKTPIKQLKKEIESFFAALKEEGVDFSATFIFTAKGKHDNVVKINCKDDHHVLDCLSAQTEKWKELNHS